MERCRLQRNGVVKIRCSWLVSILSVATASSTQSHRMPAGWSPCKESYDGDPDQVAEAHLHSFFAK